MPPRDKDKKPDDDKKKDQQPEDPEIPHAQPAEESLKIHGDKIDSDAKE
jgi:hypothetical protein